MTLNKILGWVAASALFAALFVPLVVADSLFFPFITGKAFLFRTFVEIALAAWIILMLREAAARPRLSPLLWSFVAFVAVVGLADLFGQDAWKSFWSNFERMEGYITILHLFFYFLIASSILAREKIWLWFFRTSVGVSVLVSFFALLQHGTTRVDATLGNATYLAVYVLFNIFFAFFLALQDKTLWKRIAYGAVIVVQTIVLYDTGTRGAALGLLGGAAFAALLIAVFDRSDRTRRIVAGSLVGLVVVGVLGFIAIKNADFVQKSPILSRFASISLSDAQNQARYYIWPMAISGFKERPILGWGQENFNYVFNKYYDPHMYGQEQWFDRAHNVLLDWLVASGLVGLLAYVSLWVAAGYLLWKKTDLSFLEKSVFTGLGLAYFINNLFVFDNIASYLMFVSVLAFVQFKGTKLSKPLGTDADDLSGNDLRVAGAVVLILLAGGLYFFNWRGYATASTLIVAMNALNQPGQADAAVAAFEKALSYDTLGRPEAVERLIEAASTINSSASIDTRQKFFELSSAAVDTQLSRAPGDARYEVFAGNFYMLYGMNDLAEKHFKLAMSLSPRKQTILFAAANFYLSQKRFDEATVLFKEAYELEPSYTDALNYYAVSLVMAGKEAQATALLKEKLGVADMTSDLFVQAFANLNNWSRVIAIFKTRLAANPKDMQSLRNLASAYLQSGDRASSIATLRTMIALDPTFKAEGEQYIQAIQAGAK